MHVDHAPGQIGSTACLSKKYWHIINDDFSRLFAHFANDNLNIEHINDFFITLIPKKDSPRTVNYYMFISLLNSSLKLSTKLIANRLQMVIQTVVHQNQYDFIKERTIQHGLSNFCIFVTSQKEKWLV
jgi:hypothetical protein